MKKTPLKRGNSTLKKNKIRSLNKFKPETEEQKEGREKMQNFFLEIWNSRPHYSEVSNKWLGNECKSLFLHHIIPKSICEEGKYDPENIILLTGDEHAQVEWDIYYFEEINKRREQLKIKYGKTGI